MSWKTPFGNDLLIEIGSDALASSDIACVIGSLVASSKEMNDGAPIPNCRERAPMILALSKRVSFAGPIVISKPSSTALLVGLRPSLAIPALSNSNTGAYPSRYLLR